MRCGLFSGFEKEELCYFEDEQKARQLYVRSAYQLYDKIFRPAAPYLPEDTDVLIIPDGLLHYVPFEALLADIPKEADQFHDFPYLLHRFPISYAYSATLQRRCNRDNIVINLPNRSWR